MKLCGRARLLWYFGAAAYLTVVIARCGQTAPERVSLLDLSGRHVEPLGTSRAKATVFLFIRSDCPISNRYAPEVKRLYENFAPRGVRFWLVYPDPSEEASSIPKHLAQYNSPFGALRDPGHALVRLTGVTITPEAAVFVGGGKLVYHGRIDDLYVDIGKERRAPTTHDLADVLEAILEGKAVTHASAPAVGCFISDLN